MEGMFTEHETSVGTQQEADAAKTNGKPLLFRAKCAATRIGELLESKSEDRGSEPDNPSDALQHMLLKIIGTGFEVLPEIQVIVGAQRAFFRLRV